MLASTEQPHNSALAPTPVLSPQKVPAGLRKLQQNDEKPCECESGLKSWHHLQDSCSAARRAMANLKPQVHKSFLMLPIPLRPLPDLDLERMASAKQEKSFLMRFPFE